MQNLLVEKPFFYAQLDWYFLFRKQASLLKVGVDGSDVYERYFKKKKKKKNPPKQNGNKVSQQLMAVCSTAVQG